MFKNLIVILFLIFTVKEYSFSLLPEQEGSNYNLTNKVSDSLLCAAAINNYFKNAFKDYDDYKVEAVNLPENVSSIKFLSDQVDLGKPFVSVPAEVNYNGKTIKTYLSFHIRLYKQVLFANSSIKRQSKLNPEDFELRKTEINNINGTPVYSFDEIKNSISQRSINAGELLIRESIEKIPLIKAGDKVKANISSGNVSVSIDAVSKQDGGENEIIRIITNDKKLFKAKVIDSQNVVIVE